MQRSGDDHHGQQNMNVVDDARATTALFSGFSSMNSATEPNDKENPIEIDDEYLASILPIVPSNMPTDEASLLGYGHFPRSLELSGTQSLGPKE